MGRSGIKFHSLAEGVPKQKQKREGQQNRVPPDRDRSKKVKDESFASSSANNGDARYKDPESSAYEEKMAKQAAEFDNRRPKNMEKYWESAPRRYAFRSERNEWLKLFYQRKIDEITEAQLSQHPCCAVNASALCCKRERKVLILEEGGVQFFVEVKNYECSVCHETITVHPYDVDACPTTATEYCLTWIPMRMTFQYLDMFLMNGLSSDGFLHSLENVGRQYEPMGSELKGEAGEDLIAGVSTSAFVTAVMEVHKVRLLAAIIPSLSFDPLYRCFICADEGITDRNDGLRYDVAVMADAMVGANRHKSAGRAQASLLPSTLTYLGLVAMNILADRDGSATAETVPGLAATVAAAAAAGPAPVEEDEGDDDAVLPACTTALSCNRESSFNTRAELDICGLVGVFCTHGFPALGCILAMTAPENHSYYDAVFSFLFRHKWSIGQVYLDLMCRYKARLLRLLQRLVDLGQLPQESLDRLKCLVPWMHAFDHDLKCQLKHSGLYADNAGRRIGEQSESVWSIIKAFAKRARYMTYRNWWDGYNFFFEFLTAVRQRDMAQTLQRKLKNIEVKIGERRIKLQNTQIEAAQHGVIDCDAALALLDEDAAPLAPLSPLARFVELELVLQSEAEIQKCQAVLPLPAMLGNTGIHMFRKVSEADKSKSREKLAKLRMKLGLLPGEDLDEAQRAEGLAELKTAVLSRIQFQVEQQVFKRKLILADCQGIEGTKNAKKIRKRQQAVEKNIRTLLNIIAAWNVIDSDETPAVVTEEAFRAVLQGTVPWRNSEIGANGDEATQRHYGQLYRTALNQLKRSVEEQGILRVEAVRLVNGVKRASQEVANFRCSLQAKLVPVDQQQDGLRRPKGEPGMQMGQEASAQAVHPADEDQSHASVAAEATSSGVEAQTLTAWEVAVTKGRIEMLKREELRLECIHADALMRLKPSFPVTI